MKLKVNTFGFVDTGKYMKSTYIQHTGIIATFIGVIMTVFGTILKSESYKLHVSDKTKEIDIETE